MDFCNICDFLYSDIWNTKQKKIIIRRPFPFEIPLPGSQDKIFDHNCRETVIELLGFSSTYTPETEQ